LDAELPAPSVQVGASSPPAGTAIAPTVKPVAPGTGKLVMTREHCETLGRKFAELTLQQGGVNGAARAGSAGAREAAGVGKTFSDGCVRDLVGQTVEASEYRCMLRATSPDGLLGCRR
jgi:hypothetical protein